MDGTISRARSVNFCAVAFFTLASPIFAAEVPLRADISLSRFPIYFEPNVGQVAEPIRYVSHGAGYGITVLNNGIDLHLSRPSSSVPSQRTKSERPAVASANLLFRFVGSRPNATLKGEQLKGSVSNYFIGNNAEKWHSNVPNFGSVRYKDIYPGIDWVVYGNPQQLEYDLVVAPDADTSRVKLQIAGADKLSVDSSGSLLVSIRGQLVRQLKPTIYQRADDGSHLAVRGHYSLTGPNEVAFTLGDYDHGRELVIDPVLSYSSYLGGSNSDQLFSVAVDGSGNTYVSGNSNSSDYPLAVAYENSTNRNTTVVTKISPSGGALVYSTFIGGMTGDGAANQTAITVDSSGAVYLAANVFSTVTDYPVVNPFQATNTVVTSTAGSACGVVSKLNASGTALVFSTYLCGTNNDTTNAIAVDGSGSLYVAGSSRSADFPVKNAYQSVNQGNSGFLTKFVSGGNSLAYSTFLGGSSYSEIRGLAVDSAGAAYVTGQTSASDFPILNAFQASRPTSGTGNFIAFVTKFNSAGTSLVYSTYLGGSSGADVGNGIAVDSAGAAYVTGGTLSTDFPTSHAFQNANTESPRLTSGFVTKLNPSGSALLYSTYLGGSGTGPGSLGDEDFAIAVDTDQHAYVTGFTTSTDYPTINPTQASWAGGMVNRTSNAIVTELSSDGGSLLFSTYLGGTGNYGPGQSHSLTPSGDVGHGIAVDADGNIYVVGSTASSDFPLVSPYQSVNRSTTQYGANITGFVTKYGKTVSAPPSPPPPTNPPSGNTGGGSNGGGEIGLDISGLMFFLVLYRQLNSRGRRKLIG